MLSKRKLTFSLASLIVIFALALGTTFVANAEINFGDETIDDQTYVAAVPIKTLTLPVATGAGGVIAYSIDPAVPAGLAFYAGDSTTDPVTPATITGTPTAATGIATYTFTATDNDPGDDSPTAVLTFSLVVNANSSPTFPVGTEIGDLVFRVGDSVNVTLPEAMDVDVEAGDVLTYSIVYPAEAAGGNPADELPTGLVFIDSSHTISGIAQVEYPSYIYRLRIKDLGSTALTANFTIEVRTDTAPAFADDAEIDDLSFTLGKEITPQALPEAADEDGDTLTYTITPALPLGLVLVSEEGVAPRIWGTPAAKPAVTAYKLIATDETDKTAEFPFNLSIVEEGDDIVPGAPTFDPATQADLTFNVGTDVGTVQLPVATDPDGTDVTHSLSPDPPDGLEFDADAVSISGTPTAAAAAADYTLTATDADAEPKSIQLQFSITVEGADADDTTPPVLAASQDPDTSTTPADGPVVVTLAFDETLAAAPTVAASAKPESGEGTYDVSDVTAVDGAENTYTVTVTPKPAVTGAILELTVTLTVTAEDADGNALADTNNTVDVVLAERDAPQNSAPVFGKDEEITDIQGTEGDDIGDVDLPGANDADLPDDTLTYTIDPPVTDIGLTFDADADPPTLTGTLKLPTEGDAYEEIHTYTVTDAIGATDTLEFTVTIYVSVPPVPAFDPEIDPNFPDQAAIDEFEQLATKGPGVLTDDAGNPIDGIPITAGQEISLALPVYTDPNTNLPLPEDAYSIDKSNELADVFNLELAVVDSVPTLRTIQDTGTEQSSAASTDDGTGAPGRSQEGHFINTYEYEVMVEFGTPPTTITITKFTLIDAANHPPLFDQESLGNLDFTVGTPATEILHLVQDPDFIYTGDAGDLNELTDEDKYEPQKLRYTLLKADSNPVEIDKDLQTPPTDPADPTSTLDTGLRIVAAGATIDPVAFTIDEPISLTIEGIPQRPMVPTKFTLRAEDLQLDPMDATKYVRIEGSDDTISFTIEIVNTPPEFDPKEQIDLEFTVGQTSDPKDLLVATDAEGHDIQYSLQDKDGVTVAVAGFEADTQLTFTTDPVTQNGLNATTITISAVAADVDQLLPRTKFFLVATDQHEVVEGDPTSVVVLSETRLPFTVSVVNESPVFSEPKEPINPIVFTAEVDQTALLPTAADADGHAIEYSLENTDGTAANVTVDFPALAFEDDPAEGEFLSIHGIAADVADRKFYDLVAQDVDSNGDPFKGADGNDLEPTRLRISVQVSNNPPAWVDTDATIEDIVGIVGTPIGQVKLPEATDPDEQEVAYSISPATVQPVTAPTPAWKGTNVLNTGLRFDPVTRILSGTPTSTTQDGRRVEHTYIATDPDDETVQLPFGITIKGETIRLPTKTSSSGPIPLPAVTIPSHEFFVLVRDIDASGTYDPISGWEREFASNGLPDLELFFENGGTIELIHEPLPPATTPYSENARDIVISEIMWGSDSSLAFPACSQWIEFYNTSDVAINLSNFNLYFHRSDVGSGAWSGYHDLVANSGHFVGYWSVADKGSSGRSAYVGETGDSGPIKQLVSMYRNINYTRVEHRDEDGKQVEPLKDFPSGTSEGSWFASAPPSANMGPQWIGTPGAKTGVRVDPDATEVSHKVVINEIGNSDDDEFDWIELFNTSDDTVNLKNWAFSYVWDDGGQGKETRLFEFPNNDNHKLPPKSYLVVANSDPRNTFNDLAAGIDIRRADDNQANKGLGSKAGIGFGADGAVRAAGTTAYYTVNGALNLHNDQTKRLYVLRTANDKYGKSTHVSDVVGGLSIARHGELPAGWTGYNPHATTYYSTSTWPFQKMGKAHGKVIAGRADFRAGVVYQRNYANNNPDHADYYKVKSGISENALTVRGFTGIGYDRQAPVNAENGGTPGYDNRAVKATETTLANNANITISEVMVDVKVAGPPAGVKLPQWLELYNSSLTQSVNLNGWRLEVQNADRTAEDFDVNLHGTITINEDVWIQPNETVLIVSSTGLHSDDFPHTRVINLFTSASYRQSLGTTNRRDVLLSQSGFYLALWEKDQNLNTDPIDEVGSLGFSRRTEKDNFPGEWTFEDVASAFAKGDKGENAIADYENAIEDGRRTSLIRRYDDGVVSDGTVANGWYLAVNTEFGRVVSHTYYGSRDDYATPGFRGGGPLPVELSKFRPERTDSGAVVIKWVTESELNNAGFNILRSETKTGDYKKVNAQLIAGQGTTSERTAYTWTDASAKPTVVYYYQIEDVSLDGKRQTLRVSRLKGHISAAGKVTTTWGDLKKTLRE